MNNEEFDHIIRKRVEGHPSAVPPDVWAQISADLKPRRRRVPILLWWVTGLVGSAVATFVLLVSTFGIFDDSGAVSSSLRGGTESTVQEQQSSTAISDDQSAIVGHQTSDRLVQKADNVHHDHESSLDARQTGDGRHREEALDANSTSHAGPQQSPDHDQSSHVSSSSSVTDRHDRPTHSLNATNTQDLTKTRRTKPQRLSETSAASGEEHHQRTSVDRSPSDITNSTRSGSSTKDLIAHDEGARAAGDSEDKASARISVGSESGARDGSSDPTSASTAGKTDQQTNTSEEKRSSAQESGENQDQNANNFGTDLAGAQRGQQEKARGAEGRRHSDTQTNSSSSSFSTHQGQRPPTTGMNVVQSGAQEQGRWGTVSRDAILAKGIVPTLIRSAIDTSHFGSLGGGLSYNPCGVKAPRGKKKMHCYSFVKERQQVYLDLTAGPRYVQNHLNAQNSEAQELVSLREDTESYMIGFNATARLGFKFYNGMVLNTGLAYDRLLERFDYYNPSEERMRSSVIITDSIMGPGGPTFTYDTLTTTVIGERRVRHTNSITRFSIPITFGYQWRLPKFDIGVHGGAIMNISFAQSGRVMNGASQIISLDDDTPDVYQTTAGAAFTAGAYIAYKVDRDWTLLVEPSFLTDLNNLNNAAYPVDHKQTHFGLNVGLRRVLYSQVKRRKKYER